MADRQALDLWLYGTRIARLRESGRTLHLTWSHDATGRWPINSTVLSTLLPMSTTTAPHPARVRAWFTGLLPEGIARGRLAHEAGLEPDDVFGMLHVYGRDVAGALVLQAEGSPPPGPGRWAPISERSIGERLTRAASNDAPLGVVPGITSISLAGMQPKIALHQDAQGRWFECLDGAPSTRILKPGRPGTQLQDLIHNEAWTLGVARRLGLTTIDATVERFGSTEALVVSRYDRVVAEDGSVTRRHQEDSAQMMGLNTDDPARKFQYGRAMPSLRRIAGLLAADRAPLDGLLALAAFNVAVGNTDAHAKNISVLHHDDGTTVLAPAYDISPHRHYLSTDHRAAMDVDGEVDIDGITRAHLTAEAESWGMSQQSARSAIERVLTGLAETGDHVEGRSAVADRVVTTVMGRTRNLLEGKPAGA